MEMLSTIWGAIQIGFGYLIIAIAVTIHLMLELPGELWNWITSLF